MSDDIILVGDCMKNKTKDMIECSLFTALLCIIAPVAVPVGAVPVTLAVFAVILTAAVLGTKKAAVSVCVYIFLGLVGLPVFSYGRAGLPVIFGPTGGFVWSYILMAITTGIILNLQKGKKHFAYTGSILALAVCYICGTAQFMAITTCGIHEALTVCVYPFVLFDVLKCISGIWLGTKIKKNLPDKS